MKMILPYPSEGGVCYLYDMIPSYKSRLLVGIRTPSELLVGIR